MSVEASEKYNNKYKKLILRSWQKELYNNILKDINNNRLIYWVYSRAGGEGKTTFASFLSAHHDTLELTNGKTSDIAHCYRGQKIVIFDFARTVCNPNYNAVESIKNGKIFSGKYNSMAKRFEPPFVICFSNFEPEVDRLSIDRWKIYEIIGDLLVPHLTDHLVEDQIISLNYINNLDALSKGI